MGVKALRLSQDTSQDKVSLKRYDRIAAIDGQHPFREAAPFAYVEYQVRKLSGGRVLYFNFALAEQMGLIPKGHEPSLNAQLEKTLLDTFALRVINEHDIQKETQYPKASIKANRYMATRYLQLQHPNPRGLSSGDGRSLWNGMVTHNGVSFDITSCGTGATCLSPATAIHKRFFRSGDPSISYGCGLADLSEGITDILMSEMMTHNGIRTERVLCVIEFPGKTAITVRAGTNLLRPSHFFNHLKQGQWQRLKNVADYFIERQLQNKSWAPIPRGTDRYDYLLENIAHTFASIAAQFESEYVFCWLDWDGDNILADGGIIDFGSVRQFGLYHHEYRFDDDSRWSTTIKEQRIKARATVQTFAQLVHFLKTKEKRPHSRFAQAAILKAFDRHYQNYKRQLLLRRLGYTSEKALWLLKHCLKTVTAFEQLYYYFESAKTRRGRVKVADGSSWHAVYSMHDLLRELPVHYLAQPSPLEPSLCLMLMRSVYLDHSSKDLSAKKKTMIHDFQHLYLTLVQAATRQQGQSVQEVLIELTKRSAHINRYHRVTGDAVCGIATKLSAQSTKLSVNELNAVLSSVIMQQSQDPDASVTFQPAISRFHGPAQRTLEAIKAIIESHRDGI